LESSQIRDEEALLRLLLILASSTLYLVSSGTAVVAMGYHRLMDAHWIRGLSYFQIGWRWVKYSLTHGKRLLSFLWFEPGPDPELAFASKQQAAIPIAALDSIRLET